MAEPRYGQLSVLRVAQSTKRVEPAEDVLRQVLGALMRRPSALAALGELWRHLEACAVLQPALAGFLQLRYRRLAKGIASATAAARTVVTAARTVVPALLLLTRLLILAAHFVPLCSLWSSATFPGFLVASCVTNTRIAFRKNIHSHPSR